VKTAGPGVQVVSNSPIKLLTAQEGNQIASTVLQAHPGANVWLADDDTAIGMVSALQAAGKKASDKIYVSGVNGQVNALDAVKSGGLFREDIAFPNAVYEYATGQLCCDWIEGKSIPEVMAIKSIVTNPSNAAALLASNSDPATAFHQDVSKYVTYLGNTSYQAPRYTPSGILSGVA
jgi:ribose transport system substrate-binding protein